MYNAFRTKFATGPILVIGLLTGAISVAQEARVAPENGETMHPEAKVVFVVTHRNDPTVRGLTEALDAHLNTLPARLEVREGTPSKDAIHEAADAAMILWLGEKKEQLFIWCPELEAEPRPVAMPGPPPGSQAWLEALAATVYSDLLAVIPEPVREPEPTGDEPNAAADEPEASPSPPETSTTSEEPPPTEEPLKAEPQEDGSSGGRGLRNAPLWLGVRGAYAPSWPIRGETVQHGTRIGLALFFLRYFGADLSVEVLPSFAIQGDEDKVSLRRCPLRLSLRGVLPLQKFWLSAGVGLLLELSRIRGFDGALQEGNADQMNAVPGTALELEAGYWIFPWLGIIVGGDLDLASRAVVYTVQGEPVARVRVARPAVAVGLVIGIPVKGGVPHEE